MSLEILDQSVAALKQALPNYSLGELELLRKAEQNGKTRVSALAAIDEAIAAFEEELPDEPPVEGGPAIPGDCEEVENIKPGSDITLHDGRHLLFGERAVVPSDLAETMRERGQVA